MSSAVFCRNNIVFSSSQTRRQEASQSMLPLRRAWRHRCPASCFKRGLSLAYNLHEPHEPGQGHAPLILLHGLFGSKQNNRTISKALARDLKTPVYALDLRNHGDSPHDPVHDYSAMANDVEEFIQQHNLRLPTLIGHSMSVPVLCIRSCAS